ncbi:MAG: recombination protein RecR [Synergistaceae bacterium]|nr:recombination protein RecR [Synergistaceae bacterium]
MDPLNELVSSLKKFPGIGLKSARRIAYYLMRQDTPELERLGSLIAGLKKDLYTCSQCGNVSPQDPCTICSDPLRKKDTLCIVEDIEALSVFEQAGIYNGLYHVLGGRISPASGNDLSDEAAEFLRQHIMKLRPSEVIIATTPRIEGDIAYYTLLDVLQGSHVKKITRLAYGLPLGGSIEFADRVTLHSALEGRRQIM